MSLIEVIQSVDRIGKPVTVRGWVHSVRDMGQIKFIDLRDHTGLLQVVVKKEIELPQIGNEYVIEVSGEVRERGEKFVNDKIATGRVELGAKTITVLSESAEPPFDPTVDTSPVSEELRLKYRYLDLRSERMQRNLRLRHRVVKFMRDFLDQEGFIEVETPILTKGTPEGSREFIVPSRLHAGKFYVLPQSPQQFKQLLMVGGIGKYFQIARSFRDEDQRADRQVEFTQLDIEMSFVSQEEILRLNERLVRDLVATVAPDKKLPDQPFPRLTFAEAMSKYKSDKPDLRKDKTNNNELAFCFVIDPPLFEKGEDDKIDASHHPFTSPKDGDAQKLAKDPLKAVANAYDLVLNGVEMFSGSIRIHDPLLQRQVFEILGLSNDDINARFGHILEAFRFGVPPHGGIGFGVDRLLMVLAGENNIREVIAFPKTGDARDLMMGAPSALEARRLREANIESLNPKKGR